MDPEGTPNTELKTCPACAEHIKAKAIICRYCGFDYRTLSMKEEPATLARATGRSQRVNPFAIAALVLGIVWIYGVGAILALVFGYIAKGQIDRSPETESGRGLATAGIVLGWVGVGGTILLIVVLAASAATLE